jgi:hypothetical protein
MGSGMMGSNTLGVGAGDLSALVSAGLLQSPVIPGIPTQIPDKPGMSGIMLGGFVGDGGGENFAGGSGSGFVGSDTGSEFGGYGGGSGGSFSGSGGYGGDMSVSGIYTGAPAQPPLVDYLLIRFFDFNVELGKTYRYRVRVYLEDPNHPENAMMEPSERFLDDAVKTRVAQVAKKEQREFWIATEFSEPSEPITVQMESSAIAGAIAPVKTAVIKEAGDLNIEEEPTGKVMSVVWDSQRAVDVPAVVDVQRGTVLNFKSNADVIHPTMLLYKRLKDVEFHTDRFVADIRGGVALPNPVEEEKKKEKGKPAVPVETPETLYALGEYAFVDSTGKLRVRTEFDDWESFKRLGLPPQPESATAGYGGEYIGDPGASVPDLKPGRRGR